MVGAQYLPVLHRSQRAVATQARSTDNPPAPDVATLDILTVSTANCWRSREEGWTGRWPVAGWRRKMFRFHIKRGKLMQGKQEAITGQPTGHGVRRRVLICILAGGLSGLVATAAARAAEVTPPDAIAKAGKIVFCTDISGPPLEYYDENNKPIGSDIDIGTEIARRMGVA